MAKPNYGYEKYRKELAKKKKQEQKRQRKLAKRNMQPKEHTDQPPQGGSEPSP